MATSVRLDDDFVSDAQLYAKVSKRSTPKQIEHWAEIGRIVEDNPDHAKLALSALKKSDYPFEPVIVKTATECLQILEKKNFHFGQNS